VTEENTSCRRANPGRYANVRKGAVTEQGWVMAEEQPLSCLDKNQWPRIADWLEERRKTYTEAIRGVLADDD
jgi:hypothetical protein